MTGGRLKKIKKYLGKENFFLTYGDGLSNVNLRKLLKFHIKKKGGVSYYDSSTTPSTIWSDKNSGGEGKVIQGKSKLDEGWINGGFFVINSRFLDYIDNSSTFLERSPLEKAAKQKQLFAFKHDGFWQCMDTKRDKDNLDFLFKNRKVKF